MFTLIAKTNEELPKSLLLTQEERGLIVGEKYETDEERLSAVDNSIFAWVVTKNRSTKNLSLERFNHDIPKEILEKAVRR